MVVGEDIALSNTNTEGDDVSHVEWASNAANCPAGTMEVRTFVVDGTAGTFGETDFGGIQLFQFDQGFTFVIP
jgi:hypothetical protein